jgi:hypothetical protein
MAIMDAKLPAWQASMKAVAPTKVEAKTLEGKAPLVIDGGTLGSEVRILLKDQAKAEQNGLFEVTTNEAFGGTGTFAGSGSFAVGNKWVLTRTSDADSSGEVTEGMLVPVEDGETNQATSWIQRTAGPIEVGVTAQSFEPLVAGARGNAGGDLEGLYSKPSIAEGVIDNSTVAPEAAIGYSKLNLAAKVASSDLAPSSKEAFLQLLVGASRKISMGTATAEWPGGSLQSNALKISHGLGVEPKVVFAIESGFSVPAAIYCGEKGATTFSVLVHTVNGAVPGKGFTCSVDWVAIG